MTDMNTLRDALHDDQLLPLAWPAPERVRAFVTTRAGGVSGEAWGLAGGAGGGLNLGARCGDDPLAVQENRRRLRARLPGEPVWLRQVHGIDVLAADATADRGDTGAIGSGPHGAAADVARSGTDEPADGGTATVVAAFDGEPVADAAITQRRGQVLAVLTADCLPVFFCDAGGRAVGIAHAGWRGLAAGVLEQTLLRLRSRLPGTGWLAHLGPGIGPRAFEIGADVHAAFVEGDAAAADAFVPTGTPGKWWCDLYALARLRLARAGIDAVTGGEHCTASDPQRFYSHRRDRTSGRLASVIWLR